MDDRANASDPGAVIAPQSIEPPNRANRILEQTWDFFASVPVATVLLFTIALGSVVGTFITQEGQYSDWRPPAEFYPVRYGPVLGTFLYKTGMTRMYTSWWFLTLLFLLGASLVVCSLERFIPLWRSVQRPNPAPPVAFIKHLKYHLEFRPDGSEPPFTRLAQALRSHRYNLVLTDDRLYADKGRWGRWGPYITHIGLLAILVGAMMRAIPGAYFDQSIWVPDGATVKVPNANWYIQSERFVLETYEDETPKAYRTQAVVIDGGVPVKRYTISMNQPLFYKWIELYQSSFSQEFGAAQVAVSDRATDKVMGTLSLDLQAPAPSYTVDDYSIRVKEYFPDFGMDAGGKPITRSGQAQNPAFKLEVVPPGGEVYTTWYFVLYPEIEFHSQSPIRFTTVDAVLRSTTGLRVKKDLGIPVIYLGLLIVTLGVGSGLYLSHRRIWAAVDGGAVMIGGWTNRNHGGFRSEVAALAAHLDLHTNPYKDPMGGGER